MKQKDRDSRLLRSAIKAMAPLHRWLYRTSGSLPRALPVLLPPMYVLDTLLPIVDLHQERNWVPARSRPWEVWYEVLAWVLIVSGRILTTAVVAGIGSLWRRE